MVEATHENWLPRKFCYLDSLLDGRWLLSKKKLCMHGYHVYDIIIILWEATVGELLVCVRDLRNTYDGYTVVGGNYSWWQNVRG